MDKAAADLADNMRDFAASSPCSVSFGAAGQPQRRKNVNIKERIVVFVDGPDPDNLLCVLAAYHLLCKDEQHLHIVLTGRPVDLTATCLTPTLLQQEFNKGKVVFTLKYKADCYFLLILSLACIQSIKELLKADCETSPGIPEHGEAVLQDFGERLQQFLSQCEVDEDRCHYYHVRICGRVLSLNRYASNHTL
jgi:hypothetical protein